MVVDGYGGGGSGGDDGGNEDAGDGEVVIVVLRRRRLRRHWRGHLDGDPVIGFRRILCHTDDDDEGRVQMNNFLVLYVRVDVRG